MFGWARLAVFGLIFLTIVYYALSWYSRSMRREKLEKQFDAGDVKGDRDAYIRQGIEDYNGSLRHKLIWGVYVIPICIFVFLIYATNFQ